MSSNSSSKIVNLDKSYSGYVSSDDYGDSDRFLWESLLVFALRRGFHDAAQSIIKAMKRLGQLPACLLFWCVATQSSYLIAMARSEEKASFQIATRLEELSQVATRLVSKLDKQNPLVAPLNRYKLNADKLIMHFYLEIDPLLPWPELIQKLNQCFPVSSLNSEIQTFRCEFAKLLVSVTDTAQYLKTTWQPNRVTALKALAKSAQQVTLCFPRTIIDEVGTGYHEYFVTTTGRIKSNLSTVILSVLHDPRQVCTQEHLVTIAKNAVPL